MERTNQSLKDIFETVLGERRVDQAEDARPSIYVKGDGNVILLRGTVHLVASPEVKRIRRTAAE